MILSCMCYFKYLFFKKVGLLVVREKYWLTWNEQKKVSFTLPLSKKNPFFSFFSYDLIPFSSPEHQTFSSALFNT